MCIAVCRSLQMWCSCYSSETRRPAIHHRAPAEVCVRVCRQSRRVSHVCAAPIAGSRGKLIYSTVDRRTLDHPPPPAQPLPDKRRQIKCGRTEMLLLQSIKFLLQPPRPRRTSIRPVGNARSARYRSDRLSSVAQLFNIRRRLPLSATICHRGAATRHWGPVSTDGRTDGRRNIFVQ